MGPGSHAYFQFDIRISHVYSIDAGSSLVVACLGFTPEYSMHFYLGGSAAQSIPAVYTVQPGDQIETYASITVATGAISVSISDSTQNWNFSTTSTETASTTEKASVEWFLLGTTTDLPQFTTFQTTGDMLTLGKHSGVLGSFLTVTSDTLMIYNMINKVTSDVLAQPGPINTTPSSFSFFWIQSN